MALKKKDKLLVQSILLKTIPRQKPVSWTTLCKAVKAAGVPVTNWLHVRAILQGLLSAKIIARTADLNDEKYARL